MIFKRHTWMNLYEIQQGTKDGDMKDALLVDLSDTSVKRRLMIEIGRLKGLHEIYIKPRKLTRSLDQNAYYWAAVVAPFNEWLREVYGDSAIDKEQAHEMLKVKILGLEEKEHPETGEKLTLIPRSKTLTTEQFAEYIEKCAAWLSEFCGIIVAPSELFYERPATRAATKKQTKSGEIDF